MISLRLLNFRLRAIHGGRVACPLRTRSADIDIDVCRTCVSLYAIDQAEGVEYVRCRGQNRSRSEYELSQFGALY